MALAALTALVVVLIIGLGLLTLGSNARLSGQRMMRVSGARVMADSGIEYGYWQYKDNHQLLPYTQSRNLGKGQFTVSVTDNNANIAGTVKVVSTGTQNGDSIKATRVLLKSKTIYDYAVYSGTNLSSTKTSATGASGANGDIGANGNISLTATTVNGYADATGTISVQSITGAKTPGNVAMTFPTFSATSQGTPDRTFTGNTSLGASFAFLKANELVVINGNATFPGTVVSGTGTIIVIGTVTLNGDISYAFSTDKMAVLSTGSLIDAATGNRALSAVGFYYAHNSSGTATLQHGNAGMLTVTGSLAADSFSLFGGLTVTHDSSMNPTLASQMHLP